MDEKRYRMRSKHTKNDYQESSTINLKPPTMHHSKSHQLIIETFTWNILTVWFLQSIVRMPGICIKENKISAQLGSTKRPEHFCLPSLGISLQLEHAPCCPENRPRSTGAPRMVKKKKKKIGWEGLQLKMLKVKKKLKLLFQFNLYYYNLLYYTCFL